MKNISKLVISAASILGITTPAVGRSSQNPVIDSNESVQRNTLVDQLLKNQIFKLDSFTQTVKIDEDKLLITLRAELSAKLAERKMSVEKEAVYKDLYENIKPGSFGSTNEGRYGTMDFNKGN